MMKWTVSNPDTKLYRFVAILFSITVILRFILIGYYMPDYGGIDMNVIYGIQRLILQQPLYQDPQIPTYAIIQYTPVFYHVVAFMARMLHIQATDVHNVYVITRTVALVCNLLTVVVVTFLIKTWGYSFKKAVVFAMPVLMILTTHYYLRGDSLHLLFFVTAMYCYNLYMEKDSFWYILSAAILSGCCIMTKQSGILCIGIIGFSLLFLQRRLLVALIYGLASLSAAIFILKLCIDNNWGGFYQNAYLGLKNGIGLDFLYTIFISQFYYDLIPCYFLGGIITYTAFKYSNDEQYRFIATGAALSFVFAVVTGLKIGSSNNYFTEFLVFVLIAFPFLLDQSFNGKNLFRIRQYDVTIKRFALIAFIILLSSKAMGFFTSMYIERRLISKPEEYHKEQLLFSYFKDNLQLQNGEFIYFNERNFLDNIFIGYSVMPTKDVISQVYLTSHNTYNYQSFEKVMNTGSVKYIVTSTEKHNINEFEKEIPFIHFDPAKFQWIVDIGGFSIYKFSDL